jgi:hypothetical protein
MYLYIGPSSLHNWLPKVKPEISSVEVHPQLSHYTGIPMDDDALEGGGSFWPLTGYNGYE